MCSFTRREGRLLVSYDAPAARRSSAAVTFALLSVSTGSFAMLQSLISPVLPTVQHALHTSQSGVSWDLIAWLLSASVAPPFIGRRGDKIGKEKTLRVLLVAISAGSLVAALALDIGVMIAGRVIQGLGGAGFPGSFGIIRDGFHRRPVPP